jgi:hypothetical protein
MIHIVLDTNARWQRTLKAAYFYEAVENHVALIGIAAYTLQVHIVSIPPPPQKKIVISQ